MPTNVNPVSEQEATMQPRFLFLPHTGLEDRSDKRVKLESQKYATAARKHVMRDIGLARRKKKKRGVPTQGQSDAPSLQPNDERQSHVVARDLSSLKSTSVPISVDSSRIDPFVRWPVQMTRRMRFLLDHLLTTDCRKVSPLRTVCKDLLSLDCGWFHHALAISAFCLSGRSSGGEALALRLEALQYYDKGLRSIRERLCDISTRLSDGVILSILGIAVHTTTPRWGPESASDRSSWYWETGKLHPRVADEPFDEWALHMKAIHSILRDRGGIATLDANVPLRYWLYLVDLQGAVVRDSSPFFPIPPCVLPTPKALFASQKVDVVDCILTWMREFPAQQTAINIFGDLDSTIMWLEEQLKLQASNFWDRVDSDGVYTQPLVHRCLRLGSGRAHSSRFVDLDDNSDVESEDFTRALRHAMILFLFPIRRAFCNTACGSDVHLTKLSNALKLCVLHDASMRLSKLLFWMLVIGATEACHLSRDASWFFEKVMDSCSIHGIEDYLGVRGFIEHAMSTMIWFDEPMALGFDRMLDSLRDFMAAESADQERMRN